jgi:hypothetical protein
VKADVSPSFDETIDEIAKELKPWRQGWRKEEVLRVVIEQIELVQWDLSDFDSRDAIIKNRDDAKDIIKLIAKLKQRLSKVIFLRWPASPAIPAVELLTHISAICKNFAEPRRADFVKT